MSYDGLCFLRRTSTQTKINETNIVEITGVCWRGWVGGGSVVGWVQRVSVRVVGWG